MKNKTILISLLLTGIYIGYSQIKIYHLLGNKSPIESSLSDFSNSLSSAKSIIINYVDFHILKKDFFAIMLGSIKNHRLSNLYKCQNGNEQNTDLLIFIEPTPTGFRVQMRKLKQNDEKFISQDAFDPDEYAPLNSIWAVSDDLEMKGRYYGSLKKMISWTMKYPRNGDVTLDTKNRSWNLFINDDINTSELYLWFPSDVAYRSISAKSDYSCVLIHDGLTPVISALIPLNDEPDWRYQSDRPLTVRQLQFIEDVFSGALPLPRKYSSKTPEDYFDESLQNKTDLILSRNDLSAIDKRRLITEIKTQISTLIESLPFREYGKLAGTRFSNDSGEPDIENILGSYSDISQLKILHQKEVTKLCTAILASHTRCENGFWQDCETYKDKSRKWSGVCGDFNPNTLYPSPL